MARGKWNEFFILYRTERKQILAVIALVCLLLAIKFSIPHWYQPDTPSFRPAANLPGNPPTLSQTPWSKPWSRVGRNLNPLHQAFDPSNFPLPNRLHPDRLGEGGDFAVRRDQWQVQKFSGGEDMPIHRIAVAPIVVRAS